MLLEMNPSALQQLLGDHSMLEVAVKKAQSALEAESWTFSPSTEETLKKCINVKTIRGSAVEQCVDLVEVLF